MTKQDCQDVTIIGGGIAGLSAAVLLARKNLKVTVLERSAELGGRAQSDEVGSSLFDRGPHALMRGGPAYSFFKGLDASFTDRAPAPWGVAYFGDETFSLPQGPLTIMGCEFLSVQDRVDFAAFFADILTLDSDKYDGLSLSDWFKKRRYSADLIDVLNAYFRLISFTDDPDLVSAGAFLEQFQKNIANGVVYVAQGWRALVTALELEAKSLGVELRRRAQVTGLIQEEGGITRGVQLSKGEEILSEKVVFAVSPSAIRRILQSELPQLPQPSKTSYVACLSVALSQRGRSPNNFALGIEHPLYASIYTDTVSLGSRDSVVVHGIHYLKQGAELSPETIIERIEGIFDSILPRDWKNQCLHRRFLPRMAVNYDMPLAETNGLKGRSGIRALNMDNVFCIGDWVGAEGYLVDASVASAKLVSTELTGELRRNRLSRAFAKYGL